jgi:hypothetical protein
MTPGNYLTNFVYDVNSRVLHRDDSTLDTRLSVVLRDHVTSSTTQGPYSHHTAPLEEITTELLSLQRKSM